MTATREARCERSDLPPAMCAHCRGHFDVVPTETTLTEDDIGPRFTARYSGHCGACDGWIRTGETIGALVDGGGFACPGCLP